MSGAYRSSSQTVLDDWERFLAEAKRINQERDKLSKRYDGRHLVVGGGGFSHGDRVVGIEIYEHEKGGDLIGQDGELRVPKIREYPRRARPNLRRKAGKELQEEFNRLEQKGPEITGMPGWTLFGGFRALKPGILLDDGYLWFFWGDKDPFPDDHGPGGSVDMEIWERMPLSAYYAMIEARGEEEAEAS